MLSEDVQKINSSIVSKGDMNKEMFPLAVMHSGFIFLADIYG